MQAVKKPVRGRASNTEERNWSSSHTTYDSYNSKSFASKDNMSSRKHLTKKVEKIR